MPDPRPNRVRVADASDPRLDDVRDLNRSDSRPDLPGGKGLVIAEGALIVPRLAASRFPLRCIAGILRPDRGQRGPQGVLDAPPPGFA